MSPGASPETALSPPCRLPYGAIDERCDQAMVRMRDGIRLATDVYLPAGAGPHPTVLVRLPYDKSAAFAAMPQVAGYIIDRGYAVVVQDVRGKVRSEGDTYAFVHEAADGYDTLDWIAAQPWSDGAVGMFGDSYYGYTQWAAAASRHPALRCIVPRNTATEIGTDWMFYQGVFNLYTMAGWAGHTWIDNAVWEGAIDWSIRPLLEVIPRAFGGRRSRSLDAWAGLRPDDPFWTRVLYGGGLPSDGLRIPALHSTGWWDVFQRGQFRDFARASATSPATQYLIVDHTDHFDDELADWNAPGADTFADDAAVAALLPRYCGPALEFFDHHLSGRSEKAPARVRWRLSNAEMRDAATWPPAGVRHEVLVLASAERALHGPEGGRLARRPDGGRHVVAWTHDARNPVPSSIHDPWQPLLALPDEREVEGRDDVVTFTSDPAVGPLDLAGPVRLTARVGSSAPSMHVIAKLVDVHPGGMTRRILDGAAFAPTAEAETVVEVDLGHTGYRLEPGHRLRLDIASSDFPRHIIHPATADDPWRTTDHRASEQRLVCGGVEPSRLTLTILAG